MADPKQIADALAQDQLLAQFNRDEGQAQPWYMKPMDMEGRATFLPFKDSLPGSVMNQRELALPGLIAGAVNAFTAPGRVSTQGFDAPEEALNLATNVFGGGITTGKMMRNPTGVGGKDLALNVYHGTPHEIKGGFDLAKVGTGEGAQSFGHGMYFAENPAVAKDYQKKLSSRTDLNEMPSDSAFIHAVNSMRDSGFTNEQIPEALKKAYKSISDKDIKLALQATEKGNLYKADIPDAAIPMMLDYDKPIKSQPQLYELVRQSITDPDIRKTFETNAESGISGANVYKNYISGKTDAERSANAAKLGITGIRYLDQGSRGVGKGSSNFVVFKPEIVDIIERNNVPTRKELLQQEFDKLDK